MLVYTSWDKNKKLDFEMCGAKLKSIHCIEDLGVKIASYLNMCQHCTEAAKKANKMLGFTNRNFTFENKDVIVSPYGSLARPHLKYATVQFRSPHYGKDIAELGV